MSDGLRDIVDSYDVERLATGFMFTEGPLWHPEGYLLFVDIRRSIVLAMTPGEAPEVVRDNSGASNGLAFDLQGRLLMCEGDGRRVSRWEAGGEIVTVVATYRGNRLNRPNDLVVRSDGSVYFTDPGSTKVDPSDRDIHGNAVYQITTSGDVVAAVPEFEWPNGLAFSPDEAVLYVANSRASMHISAFDVGPDGALTGGRVFAEMAGDESEGHPDGMKVDEGGRVFCTGPGGVWVFEPSGEHVGTLRLPETPFNMAWGGADRRTLFFTARTSVYSMRMQAPGAKVPGGA
jgi:gluconolactonase